MTTRLEAKSSRNFISRNRITGRGQGAGGRGQDGRGATLHDPPMSWCPIFQTSGRDAVRTFRITATHGMF
jgi:hypothetical protein